MKKIFVILLCAFITSCDTANNDGTVLPSGKIVKIIENNTEKPIIYVKFPGTGNYSYTFKFIGSDSCKIGQSINFNNGKTNRNRKENTRRQPGCVS